VGGCDGGGRAEEGVVQWEGEPLPFDKWRGASGAEGPAIKAVPPRGPVAVWVSGSGDDAVEVEGALEVSGDDAPETEAPFWGE
jgi:hypothetical protein